MISDYEDDEHFCIKCHITIHGLNNYVSHRKANCVAVPKTIPVIPKSLPLPLLAQDESFGLKADDFFSSLELQSSSKKPAAPSTSGKTSTSGILTRSKTYAVIHATAGSSTSAQDIEPHQSKSGKNAWIGGHQLKELGSGDNQTRLIKAVDNLTRTTCLNHHKKEEPPATSSIVETYNDNSEEESDDYDYEDEDDDDEDDDDEEPPQHHTGGKWAPNWNYQNVPPISHTGGKWKPSKMPVNTLAKRKSSAEDSNTSPPNHTKGKWRPVHPGKEVEEQDGQFPPPSHTKGKWKPPISIFGDDKDDTKNKRSIIEQTPPFRKSNGSIQYWCNPCNRVLSSKIVYERHLKSDLHFKRMRHEAEFDDDASMLPRRTSTHLNTNRDKLAKRTIREPVEYWTGANNKAATKNAGGNAPHSCIALTSAPATMAALCAPTTTITRPVVAAAATPKRIRRRIYTKCVVCLARVTAQTMGKHLISHYHCRKGDIHKPEAKQMVLEHIHAVVLQAPYQCALCKFYCNSSEYFLQHWNSTEHIANVESVDGVLTCSFCKFKCATSANSAMHRHLVSEEHEEVISVINRSVPIIIKTTFPINCATCNEEFTLNIQLRKHCIDNHHEYCDTATDAYQQKELCSICKKTFHSSIALQRHLRTHNTPMYFCSLCEVRFATKEEIQQHRLSKEHRRVGNPKKCNHCPEIFNLSKDLRAHLIEKHSEDGNKCLICAQIFATTEELSAHMESKSCVKSKTNDSQHEFRCDICNFGCATVSKLLFHKALHTEPVRSLDVKQAHYKCLLCEKYFAKTSLLCHIRNQHTKEKTYKCNVCEARFGRRNNWLVHVKNHEQSSRPVVKGERNFLCATCGAKFTNNATLKKHMLIHSGKRFKCEHPECGHLARTPADLRVHQKSTHATAMSYRCDRCDYRGKTMQHLKRHSTVHDTDKKYQCNQCSFTCRLKFHLRRHQRIHSGVKPYACPHCEYRCNNLENLRKHVLSTSKHPGKCIYECKFCNAQFQSNFAKDFKAHLLSVHSDVFGSVTKAAGYIAGIYDCVGDVDATAAAIAIASTSEGSAASGIYDGDAAADGAHAAELHKENKINPGMLGSNDASGASLIQSQETTFEHKGPNDEELFPMYVIAKEDEVVYVDDKEEAWCMVGSFGVEASGALVSFDEESETEQLFEEPFQ